MPWRRLWWSRIRKNDKMSDKRVCLHCRKENDASTSVWRGDCEFTMCASCGKHWMSAIRYQQADPVILNPEAVVNVQVMKTEKPNEEAE